MDDELAVAQQQPAPIPAAPQPFGGLIEPNSTPQIGPPATTQEFQERKTGWQKFAERLQNDPQTQQLVLGIGLRMMQPIPRGQSTGGHIAGAIGDAMNYQAQAGAQAREEARRLAESNANIEHRRAVTQGLTQDQRYTAEDRPQVQQVRNVEIQRAQTQLQVAQQQLAALNAQVAAGLTSPEHLKKVADAEAAKTQAEIDLRRAQTGQAQAHGRAYDAVASGVTRPNQTRQAMARTELQDGSIMTTYLINGQNHYEIIRPAMDGKAAEKTARESVADVFKATGKETPGWLNFGKNKDEFERLVASKKQQLMQPQVQWLDSANKPVQPPSENTQRAQPNRGATPADVTQGLEEQRAGEPARISQAIQLIKRELAALPPGPTQQRAELERDLAALENPQRRGDPKPISSTSTTAPNPNLVRVLQGDDGNLFVEGKPKPGPQNAVPSSSPAAASYVKKVPRSSSFVVEAPSARSPANKLHGQKFATEAEALAAVEAALRGQPVTQQAGKPGATRVNQ